MRLQVVGGNGLKDSGKGSSIDMAIGPANNGCFAASRVSRREWLLETLSLRSGNMAVD
jgi:hypothetical protein